MGRCQCGLCEEETHHGQFAQGHDQKLRASLESQVGGLLALRTLVSAAAAYAAGSISDDAFTQQVRAIFFNTRNR